MLPAPQSARLNALLDLVGSLFDAADAAQTAIRQAHRKRLPARTVPKRRPGDVTPMWNAVVTLLHTELAPYGSKARLARYLGVPRQRVTDFVRGHRRLPDAETALQILFFISERRLGHDPSL